jgi:hypothetical protein
MIHSPHATPHVNVGQEGGMMGRILLVAAAALLACVPLAGSLVAATTPADTSATVARARELVSAHYVLPDVAGRIADAIGRGEAAGHYRGLTGEALAQRMNDDMATVTADRHLGVSYDPALAARLAAVAPQREQDDHAEPPGWAREMERQNLGIRELARLPGNIRYLAYDGFMWSYADNGAAIANAMAFLRGGDAYIIDLRRNGGGSPAAVAAIASYFLPEGTPLMRFEMRGEPGEETKSPKAPFSLTGKPLYVLVGGGTASAAEEFATHVSAYGFGTLIGENTAGAGFRNDLYPLPGGYVISISVGRAISLKSGKDWEARGVAPAIATSFEAALPRARAEAMAAILARSPAAERTANERLLAYYRALERPPAPARPMAAYAGRYGERTVAVAADGLVMQRASRPPVRLVAISPDRFAPENTPETLIAFDAAGGKVVALRIEPVDGSSSRIERNAELP